MISISIIVPIYNVEKYIERCLQSIANQTYNGKIECLLINDATPDESIKVTKCFLSKYSGNILFKIISHEENKGLSEARNTGIRHAMYDYLYFLDSDDELSPNCIENLAVIMENHKVDFCMGHWINPLRPEKVRLNKFSGLIIGNKEICEAFFREKWDIMAWDKLISKEFLLSQDLFFVSGIYYEDAIWACRLALCAQKMYVWIMPGYLYHSNPGSITHSISEKHIHDLLFVIQEHIRLSKELSIPNYFYAYVRSLCFSLLYKLYERNFSKDYRLAVINEMKCIVGNLPVWREPKRIKDCIKILVLMLPSHLCLAFVYLINRYRTKKI